jgi:succinate dehydrogenase / fumarate reductase cytochrome b subunit
MAREDRPLSPHLQIYRPQITSVLSIVHRITGVGLAFGALGLVCWLAAAAAGAQAFEAINALWGSALGILFLVGSAWALFYHLLNGIRHLFWDVGIGFELETASRSGWAVVIGSVALTALSVFGGLAARGGGL